ncbi:MAG TPA: lipopolysaccharide biosynthesis protein [Thermoanaerobaculia bacterium]|jgi:O-antigen/teichoic acid export membrane protein|nr:lipopolysaccharide biosynthesis protein [Thermoanaerobaculia bacterium]
MATPSLSDAGTAGALTQPVSAPAARANHNRLRQGGAMFAASHFSGMAMGFLGSMLLVRVARPDQVASYLMLLQAITALGLVLQLGLGPATLRFAPISRGRGGERATALLRRRLLGIQIGTWALVAPPLVLAWPWISRSLHAPDLATAAPFLISAAALASLGQLMDAYMRSFRLYSVAAPLGTFLPRALIFTGFVILWLAGQRGLPWQVLVTVYIAAQVCVALTYASVLPKTTPGEASEDREASLPPGVRTILGTSTAMGLRAAVAVLFLSSDLWLLSWARPDDRLSVAVYGIAVRVMQIMAALPGIANFLIPQEFAILYADGRRKEMERLARTASTAVGLLSLAAVTGILLLGRPLLRLAFGDAYMGGWTILLILAAGTFWDTASGSAGYVLQMSGNHVKLLYITLGAAVFKLALGVTLGRLWGGHGVALSTAVTLIAMNVAMVYAARKMVGVRTFVYLRPSKWIEVLRLLAGRRGA